MTAEVFMKSWDFLNSLTKDEIIQLLTEEFWLNAPEKKRSDWFLYSIKFEKYMERQKKHDSISLHGMTYEQIKRHFAKGRKLDREYEELSHESDKLIGRAK